MKRLHIYAKEVKFDAEYKYDKNDKKVYNVKKLRREFNNFLKKISQIYAFALLVQYIILDNIISYKTKKIKFFLYFFAKRLVCKVFFISLRV